MNYRLFFFSFFLLIVQGISTISKAMESEKDKQEIAALEKLSSSELKRLPLETLEKCSYEFLNRRISRRELSKVPDGLAIEDLINRKREEYQKQFFNTVVSRPGELDQEYIELSISGDCYGCSPLIWASTLKYENALEYVKRCIALHADINFTQDGASALTYAIGYKNAEVVELLLSCGAVVRKRDKRVAQWAPGLERTILDKILEYQLSSKSSEN